MTDIDPNRFHRLYGPASRRIAFKPADFADYAIMMTAAAALVWLVYRGQPWLAGLGLGCCLFLLAAFPLRHGVRWRVPVLVRRPQEAAYALVYRLRGVTPVLLAATGLLAADNLFIALTPGLPHHVELMQRLALGLFYAHFGLISLYRTAILVAHLRKRDTVRAFLMETSWKKALIDQPSVTLHLFHAWATGLVTHLVLIAPWYLLITHVRYSALSVLGASVLGLLLHLRHMGGYAQWFYREHWHGHATETDFIYSHGTHHDAIPTSLIGVSGNGILEGFVRHAIGNPTSYYSPLVAAALHSMEIVQDMKMHQYVPGIWPQLPRGFHEVSQHSTHHFGRLEPYGIGLRLRGGRAEVAGRKRNFPPVEILNSIEIDEALNGFEWDNPRHRRFLDLYDRYQPDQQP
jgi:hypothetical protein